MIRDQPGACWMTICLFTLLFLLGQLHGVEAAFRYLKEVAGPQPSDTGLGDGG